MARLSYSTVVRGLTVVLPLVALALLSTLFLVARTAPEDSALPFIQELRDRDNSAGDVMRTPIYTGTTDAGDAVTVRAESVAPDPEVSGGALADMPRADIRFGDGRNLRIEATSGAFASEENRLSLAGDVVITHSTGYQLFTSAVDADLNTNEATAPEPVRVEGPSGTLEAGAMVVRRKEDENVELVFTNRVKLVYRPPDRSE